MGVLQFIFSLYFCRRIKTISLIKKHFINYFNIFIMSTLKETLKKTALTLAIALLTAAGAQAQLYWGTNQTLIDGQVITSDIILTANINITVSSGTATINGVISGDYRITKRGNGRLILLQTSTYTGETRIEQGNLQLGNGSVSGNLSGTSLVTVSSGCDLEFSVPAGITVNFSPRITGQGGVWLWSSNAGTVWLRNNNSNYSRRTHVAGGRLQVDGSGSAVPFVSSPVTILEGTELRITPDAAVTTSQDITGAGKVLIEGSSTRTVQLNYARHTGGTVIENGAVLILGHWVMSGTGYPYTITGDIENNGTFRFDYQNVNTAMAFGGVISGTGKVEINANVAVPFVMSGDNTYTGETLVNANLLLTGGIRLSSSVTLGNNAVFTIQGNKTIQNLNSTFASATVNLGTHQLTLNGNWNDDAGGGTYAGKITGTGTGVAISKWGKRTLTLTGANTYTGITRIRVGTVEFSNANNFGTSTIELTSGYSGNDLVALKWAAGNNADMSGRIIVLNNRVEFDTNGNNVAFASALPDVTGTSRRIIKSGAGALTFNAANIYDCDTQITAGTLTLGTYGTIENSNVNLIGENTKFDISAGNKKIRALQSETATTEVILGANTLTLGTAGQSSGGGTFRGYFSGSGGSVTKNGTATFIMQGDHTATGFFTQNQGGVYLKNWAGNYNKGAETDLWVIGNVVISGILMLNGGNLNYDLSATPASKITVFGAVSASGNNNLNIYSDDVTITNYALIQATSGINSTDNYTLDMYGFTASLTANETALLLNGVRNPPVPGNNGIIYATVIDNNKVKLNFTRATTFYDGPPWMTVHRIYRSLSNNITTIEQCETNGTHAGNAGYDYDDPMNITFDVTNLNSGTTYWFNVVVECPYGTKAVYNPVTATTAGVGINDNSLSGLRVYPNPTNGQLRITGIRHCGLDPQSPANNDEIAGQARNDIQGVQIFDVTGRNVFNTKTQRHEDTNLNDEIVLDITELPAGVYFVRVGSETIKIVKK